VPQQYGAPEFRTADWEDIVAGEGIIDGIKVVGAQPPSPTVSGLLFEERPSAGSIETVEYTTRTLIQYKNTSALLLDLLRME